VTNVVDYNTADYDHRKKVLWIWPWVFETCWKRNGATTFSIMTRSLMTFVRAIKNATHRITTVSIKTEGKIVSVVMPSAVHSERSILFCYAECHFVDYCYADCCGSLLIKSVVTSSIRNFLVSAL
jgi:hypothetical protein